MRAPRWPPRCACCRPSVRFGLGALEYPRSFVVRALPRDRVLFSELPGTQPLLAGDLLVSLQPHSYPPLLSRFLLQNGATLAASTVPGLQWLLQHMRHHSLRHPLSEALPRRHTLGFSCLVPSVLFRPTASHPLDGSWLFSSHGNSKPQVHRGPKRV